MKQALKSVAVAVHGAMSSHRELIRGVHRYAIEHQLPWRFPRLEVRRANFEITPESMMELPIDGIIGVFYESAQIAKFRERGVSCVSVLTHFTDGTIPVVASDDFRVGFNAAQHFISQNIRHLFFYGPDNPAGNLRLEGMSAAAMQAGLVPVISLPFQNVPETIPTAFEDAFQMMRKEALLEHPCGLMLFGDGLIEEVLYVCHEMEVKLPEQLAIIGVDNENILCEMVRPSLTSIPVNSREIGYLAAEQLELLFHGKAAPSEPILVPPQAIHIRQSSDMFAVDDPIVMQALRVIRDRVGQNIGVGDLLKVIPMARRSLEDRFQKTLGFSPYEAILRSRIAHAKDLLSTTNTTIETLAIECGFNSLTRFSLVFKRITGQSPGAWRMAERGISILPGPK
jgi:LacI family transcriptional regulator